MKRKMLLTLALFMMTFFRALFADEQTPFSLALQTDFAYYPINQHTSCHQLC